MERKVDGKGEIPPIENPQDSLYHKHQDIIITQTYEVRKIILTKNNHQVIINPIEEHKKTKNDQLEEIKFTQSKKQNPLSQLGGSPLAIKQINPHNSHKGNLNNNDKEKDQIPMDNLSKKKILQGIEKYFERDPLVRIFFDRLESWALIMKVFEEDLKERREIFYLLIIFFLEFNRLVVPWRKRYGKETSEKKIIINSKLFHDFFRFFGKEDLKLAKMDVRTGNLKDFCNYSSRWRLINPFHKKDVTRFLVGSDLDRLLKKFSDTEAMFRKEEKQSDELLTKCHFLKPSSGLE